MFKRKIILLEEEQINIMIEVAKLEQVKRFKYLEVIIGSNGKQEAELNERIEKTIRVCYALNKKFISKRYREKRKWTYIKLYSE